MLVGPLIYLLSANPDGQREVEIPVLCLDTQASLGLVCRSLLSALRVRVCPVPSSVRIPLSPRITSVWKSDWAMQVGKGLAWRWQPGAGDGGLFQEMMSTTTLSR